MTWIHATRWVLPRAARFPIHSGRRRRWLGARLVILSFAVLLTGCSLLGLGDEERLGLLEFYNDSSVISVPDTVDAGANFEVAFYTFGGGCISRGDTRVEVTGNTAVVTPLDLNADGPCTLELQFLDHTTTVRLQVPGSGTLIVNGRAEPEDRSIQRVFTVFVR
jgi:hypothetical protein